MSKSITTYNGFIRLNRHIHQAAYHTAQRVNLCGVNIGVDTQVGMTLKCHNHFLEGCVSGSFAYAVDGNFYLTGSIENACYGVGCCHAQVVVAVCAQDGLAGTKCIYMLHEILNLFAVFKWDAEACCVGDIDNCSTSFDYCFYHASEIFIVGATGVFGVEFHVFNISLGIFYGSHCAFDNLFGGAIEFVFNVAFACANAGVNAFVLSKLQCFGSHIYILFYCTGKGADSRPSNCFRDFDNRLKIARTRNRESCFDNVNAQQLKILCHFNFFHGV